MWSWTSHSKNKCILNSHLLKTGCFLLTALGSRQRAASKQLQAGYHQNQALTVEHGHLRRMWGNPDKGSRFYVETDAKVSGSWLLPSSSAASLAQPRTPVTCSEHTLMFCSRGDLFPVEVQRPGSSVTVWMRWAQTPQGSLRLGVKVFFQHS